MFRMRKQLRGVSIAVGFFEYAWLKMIFTSNGKKDKNLR